VAQFSRPLLRFFNSQSTADDLLKIDGQIHINGKESPIWDSCQTCQKELIIIPNVYSIIAHHRRDCIQNIIYEYDITL